MLSKQIMDYLDGLFAVARTSIFIRRSQQMKIPWQKYM